MSIRINKVYTRSGDDGSTGLVGGKRVKKTTPRIHAFGTMDELNAVLGCLITSLPEVAYELRPILENVQQELFDLGSELATPEDGEYPNMWKSTASDVLRLEQLCDRFGDSLPELRSFILPGGSVAASFCHLARTVARRCEREVVALDESLSHKLNPEILKYLNRLNDLLFVLGRWILKKENKPELLWIKAGERQPRG